MLISTTKDKILMFGTQQEARQWFPVIREALKTPWSEPTFLGFTGRKNVEGYSIGWWEIDNPDIPALEDTDAHGHKTTAEDGPEWSENRNDISRIHTKKS
jgi:hypothetical protein